MLPRGAVIAFAIAMLIARVVEWMFTAHVRRVVSAQRAGVMHGLAIWLSA